jgi:prepilin signal peptidase PulO-like enzyme (type II secretory pathway)
MFLALGWTDWVGPQQHAFKFAAAQAAVATSNPNGITAAPDAAPDASQSATQNEKYAWPLAFHLLLVGPLLAAALIDIDSHRLPRQLITWPAAAGILIAMFSPSVQAFPLFRSHPTPSDSISLTPLATSFVGMLAAVVIRLATQRSLGVPRAREMGLWNCTLALYAVGAFLGWQAVLLVGVLAILWSFVRELPPWKTALFHVPPTAVAFLATLIWCLTERHLLAGA